MSDPFSFPEPMPSMSTPLLQQTTDIMPEQSRRPRRHTIITRPDSGMALLSDMEVEEQEQQETFDRISDILSSLIQEANEAVHSDQRFANKKPAKIFTSSTIISNNHNSQSRIPRPPVRRLRASNTPLTTSHHRNGSSSSNSSTNTSSALFSPISTGTSATLSRSPSPTTTNFKKQLFRHHNAVLRPRSCPVITTPTNTRRSIIPNSNNRKIDPITESFRRLDTSMALVDSLSRDLATPKATKNNNFTLLLLVPLLHIPHSLLTMIFDFVTSNPTQQPSQLIQRSNSSFSFTSMMFWACVFAVTNLMVDQVAVIPKKNFTLPAATKKIKIRRLSLPGTYNATTAASNAPSTGLKKKLSKVPNKQQQKRAVPVKRTWIPATIQKQYQFRLGEELPLPEQQRRNSI